MCALPSIVANANTVFAVGQSTADILTHAGLNAIVPIEARSEGLPKFAAAG